MKLLQLYSDVASAYCEQVNEPGSVRHVLDRALRTAMSERVEHSADIGDAWRAAFAADRPVVIDAMTDPEEPPIPPHISFKQVEAMTKSELGAPREGLPGAVSATREFIEELKPGQ